LQLVVVPDGDRPRLLLSLDSWPVIDSFHLDDGSNLRRVRIVFSIVERRLGIWQAGKCVCHHICFPFYVLEREIVLLQFSCPSLKTWGKRFFGLEDGGQRFMIGADDYRQPVDKEFQLLHSPVDCKSLQISYGIVALMLIQGFRHEVDRMK